jgi:arachidonate 15-lipoxygenase
MPSFAPPSEYEYDFDNHAVPGIPMPKTLPDAEKPSHAFKAVENAMRARMVGNALLAAVGLRPWRRPADFARVWRLDPPSVVVRTWASDTEFARQRLAGMEPTLIRRLADPTDIPGLPAVPDHIIRRQLGLDTSFDALVGAGKILVCDYRNLAGWPLRRGRHFVAPVAVFAWSEHRPDRPDRLMPLAIRMGQDADDPVFLPDASEAWQVAKFFVQVADGTHGDMWSHLVQSHFAATPFTISTKRKLPVGHVVRTILEPHMQLTLRVNSSFSQGPAQFLYGALMPFTEDGQKELIRNAWGDYDFQKKTFAQDLSDRGVDDPELLRDYPYRDDGNRLWGPTKAFTDAVLRHHYADDAAVAGDADLQAWIRDIREEGKVPGLPETIDDLATLEPLVANILFHFGPKHAAVHSPAADYGIFAPNMSNAAWQPPPTGEADVMHLVDYLPSRLRTVASFALHYAISEIDFGQFCGYSDGFEQALSRPESTWPAGYDRARLEAADKQLGKAADDFTFALVHAEDEIRKANHLRMSEVDAGYKFLLPSEIPNSIYA